MRSLAECFKDFQNSRHCVTIIIDEIASNDPAVSQRTKFNELYSATHDVFCPIRFCCWFTLERISNYLNFESLLKKCDGTKQSEVIEVK